MRDGLAIEAAGLTKSYGKVTVLSGIDLAVPFGSVFSLLGPNGAGKTTTVRILATLLRPDAGRVRVAGFDLLAQRRAVRQQISLTGQYAAVDETQTGLENLRMMAKLAGLPGRQAARRAAELLDRFDLAEAGRRRVGTYSGGMRRRLDLAAGLVGQPSVIFLDEPTTGLDPRSRQTMWQVVRELVDGGITVFLTTQYLEEADQLADRIAVIDGGRVVADGTPAQLKQRVGDQRLALTMADDASYDVVRHRLAERVTHADPAARQVEVPIDGSAAGTRQLLDHIDPDRALVHTFAVHTATLDDVFLALTGQPTPADALTGQPTPADAPIDRATQVDSPAGRTDKETTNV